MTDLRIALAAASVLILGTFLYRLLLPEPPAPHPAAPRLAEASDAGPAAAFVVDDSDGGVEARGQDGWRPLARGERLYPGDAIRTGNDGRATLRSAAGDELTLRGGVTLEVTSLSWTLTELTLTRGRVRAAAAATTEHLAIAAGGARAEGGGGSRFTIYADDRGAAFVATDDGHVQVRAAGRAVRVAPRTQTVVEPGAAPTDPIPVPDELFLSVRWPTGKVIGERMQLAGSASPGTVVRVNGETATVGADGKFTIPLPLVEGTNAVEVEAEDLEGRRRTDHGTVKARLTGPPLEADPSKLYDPPPGKK